MKGKNATKNTKKAPAVGIKKEKSDYQSGKSSTSIEPLTNTKKK